MKWLLKNENENYYKKYIKVEHLNKKKASNNLRVASAKPKDLSLINFVLIFLVLIQVLYIHSSEISIKIQGTGEQNIINRDFSLCPDEIYLNSNPVSFSQRNCKKITIPEGTNTSTIKLIFNKTIDDLNEMFAELTNIIEVDFSKFDCSKVTDMGSMFYGCSSITSINLANINTPLVINMESMFQECYSLEFLDLSNLNTKKVKKFNGMFSFCYNLTSLDLSSFNSENVENADFMFKLCKSLTSLDLSNFYTPKLISMNFMFESCISLTFLDVSNFNISEVSSMEHAFFDLEKLESLDLSNFSTNKVTNMAFLFYRCYKLKNINLVNFKTNHATDMESMFAHCFSLTSLDLSSFDTSSVTNMGWMFCNCTKIAMLNLSNFNTSSLTKVDYMFQNTYSIEYINLKEYKGNKVSNADGIIDSVRENVIICFDENNIGNTLKRSIRNKLCAAINCAVNWKDNQTKLIAENKTCIANCSKFKYEIRGVCYSTCPEDEESCQPKTTEIIDTTNLINNNLDNNNNDNSNNNGNSDSYNDINNNDINSDSDNKSNDSTGSNDNNNNDNNNEDDDKLNYLIKKFNITGNSNEEIYHEIINKIIINYNAKENILIEGKNNFTYQITTLENEKADLDSKNFNNSFTKIDLGECSNLLKNYHNLEKNISLILLKLEKITNISSERVLQYEVFESRNKTKLNLSICDNTTIDLYIPLILSEELGNLYNDLKSRGYDLFDINSPFYQDICTSFDSPNGTDVLLSDRIDYYYNNNETLCQSNCQFSNYSIEEHLLKCKCDVSNTKIDTKEIKKFSPKIIYQSFYETLKFSNYKILKCFNIAFSMKSLKSNIGGIISMVYFALYLTSLIIFYIKGITQLQLEFVPTILKINNKESIFKGNITNKIIKKNSKNFIGSKKKSLQNSNQAKLKKNKQRKSINKKIEFKKKTKNNPLKKKNSSKEILKSKRKSHQPNSRNIEIHSKIFCGNISLISNKNSKINQFSEINTQNKKCKSKSNSEIIGINQEEEEEKFDEFELNNMEYQKAKTLDKRAFIDIYWSIIKREHLIIFTFFIRNDHNIVFIKFSRFIFLVCTDMALNVFFFADETMHKMFLDYGKYNFLQQIPQIIYSKLVSQLIEVFLCYLSMTDKYFYEIKNSNDKSQNKIKQIIKCIKIKSLFFFIFTFLMFLFYWYVITCFCDIYENTQIAFIKDSLTSFALGLLYPFVLYLFPVTFRIIALRASAKLACLYIISDIIPFF